MGKSSKDKYELGKEMFLQGKTIEYISKELKISDSRFSKYLRECGIETNKYHKPKIDENVFKYILPTMIIGLILIYCLFTMIMYVKENRKI